MLVLLIIFMVTAPLLVTGVPIKLPENRAKPLETEDKPTIVTLNSEGKIFVNDAPVEDIDLPATFDQIAERVAGGQPPQIYLRADEALDYGRVMAVMGELNRAGLNRVSLVSNAQSVSARSR
jgi:biopolymer transport protein TolR